MKKCRKKAAKPTTWPWLMSRVGMQSSATTLYTNTSTRSLCLEIHACFQGNHGGHGEGTFLLYWSWRSRVCEVKKGNKVWKYATEWTNDLCIEKLCELAKTGEWRRAKWFEERKQKSANKMPWHRRGTPDSVGYEHVFKRCWPGPKGLGICWATSRTSLSAMVWSTLLDPSTRWSVDAKLKIHVDWIYLGKYLSFLPDTKSQQKLK